MTSLQKVAGLPLYFLALSLWSSKTTAEINVIKKNTFSHPLLAPLSLKIAGSIRPEFVWDQTHKDDVRRRGHDGGSRFRFTVGYQLTPVVSLVGRYLWGVDFGHMLGIKHHYDHTKNWDMQRQLFSGIKVERYGQLTYGHQHGVYHDVIGGKVTCGIMTVMRMPTGLPSTETLPGAIARVTPLNTAIHWVNSRCMRIICCPSITPR
ncbi:hypothetical protein [Erwinia persicina]|uniref:hypothetical protein n=1 Tax=Erwinia persicina TaxID=55211 RepID=UPI001F0766AB|nr:hypothetical protein [Erwinia persicina]